MGGRGQPAGRHLQGTQEEQQEQGAWGGSECGGASGGRGGAVSSGAGKAIRAGNPGREAGPGPTVCLADPQLNMRLLLLSFSCRGLC